MLRIGCLRCASSLRSASVLQRQQLHATNLPLVFKGVRHLSAVQDYHYADAKAARAPLETSNSTVPAITSAANASLKHVAASQSLAAVIAESSLASLSGAQAPPPDAAAAPPSTAGAKTPPRKPRKGQKKKAQPATALEPAAAAAQAAGKGQKKKAPATPAEPAVAAAAQAAGTRQKQKATHAAPEEPASAAAVQAAGKGQKKKAPATPAESAVAAAAQAVGKGQKKKAAPVAPAEPAAAAAAAQSPEKAQKKKAKRAKPKPAGAAADEQEPQVKRGRPARPPGPPPVYSQAYLRSVLDKHEAARAASEALARQLTAAATRALAQQREAEAQDGSSGGTAPPSRAVMDAAMCCLSPTAVKALTKRLEVMCSSRPESEISDAKLMEKLERTLLNRPQSDGHEEVVPTLRDYVLGGVNAPPWLVNDGSSGEGSSSGSGAGDPAAPPFPPSAAYNARAAPDLAAALLELRRWSGVYDYGAPNGYPVEAAARAEVDGGAAAAAEVDACVRRLRMRLPPYNFAALAQYLAHVAEEGPRLRTSLAYRCAALCGARSWLALPELCAALGVGARALARHGKGARGPPAERARGDEGAWVAQAAAAQAAIRAALRAQLHALRKRVVLERTRLSAPYSFEALEEGQSRRKADKKQRQSAMFAQHEQIVQDVLGDQSGDSAPEEAAPEPPRIPAAARGERTGLVRLQAVALEAAQHMAPAAFGGSGGGGGGDEFGEFRKEITASEADAEMALRPAEEGEDEEPLADAAPVLEEEGTPWEGTSFSLTSFGDPRSEAAQEMLSAAERCVFVHNLPPGCTPSEVHDMMSASGEVLEVHMYQPPPSDPWHQMHHVGAAGEGGAQRGKGRVKGAGRGRPKAEVPGQGTDAIYQWGKRRLRPVEEVRQMETHHMRSPLHARVVLATDDGYQRATHPAMRVFGVHARGYGCRVCPAHRRISLFVDHDDIAPAAAAEAAAAPEGAGEDAHRGSGSSGGGAKEPASTASAGDADGDGSTVGSGGGGGGAAASSADGESDEAERDALAALLRPHFDVEFRYGQKPDPNAPLPLCVRVDFDSHVAARAAEAVLRAKGLSPYWYHRHGAAPRPTTKSSARQLRLQRPDFAKVSIGTSLLDGVDPNSEAAEREEELLR